MNTEVVALSYTKDKLICRGCQAVNGLNDIEFKINLMRKMDPQIFVPS